MNTFNEHDTVIYTDSAGRRIDTFVIFNTDPETGLTHINHESLKVTADMLELHPDTVTKHHLPMADAFSFEIFKKLKDKHQLLEEMAAQRKLKAEPKKMFVLSKAS